MEGVHPTSAANECDRGKGRGGNAVKGERPVNLASAVTQSKGLGLTGWKFQRGDTSRDSFAGRNRWDNETTPRPSTPPECDMVVSSRLGERNGRGGLACQRDGFDICAEQLAEASGIDQEGTGRERSLRWNP